jgi:hypothetical protein
MAAVGQPYNAAGPAMLERLRDAVSQEQRRQQYDKYN